MSSAATLVLTASAGFLLFGLVTGVWKYHHILSSPNHRAPVYVDITHRASLMYSAVF